MDDDKSSLDKQEEDFTENFNKIIDLINNNETIFTDIFNIFKYDKIVKNTNYNIIIYNDNFKYIFSKFFVSLNNTNCIEQSIYVNPTNYINSKVAIILTKPKSSFDNSMCLFPLHTLRIKSNINFYHTKILTYISLAQIIKQPKIVKNYIWSHNKYISNEFQFTIILQLLVLEDVKITQILYNAIIMHLKDYNLFRKINIEFDENYLLPNRCNKPNILEYNNLGISLIKYP
uniref:Uncharacterized protein n=1 Tax=Faxonius propinquus nudivirus TaxID=3139431 RepID=A0AAU8GC23_9VIRU